MKQKLLNKLWLRVGMIVAIMTTALSGTAWAETTYKLQQVTSVEAGGLYVFEQSSRVMNNTCSTSSALQTTNSYSTSGLTGTETYVWTLEVATGGFYMKNTNETGNYPYLNIKTKTNVSFGASGSSVWSFTFQTDNTVLIQSTNNSNRYLGYNNTTDYAYKAYATSDMNYPHAIKVYKLVEEGGTLPTTYTITFNTGDGTFVGSADFPNTINSKEAGTYTLPSATRDGYTFDGWLTTGSTEPVNGSYIVSGDVDFTAQYTENAIPTPVGDLTIDFESAASTYTDWTFASMESQQTGSITAHGGTYYGTTGGKATASIATKAKVATPSTLTCYVSKQSNNTTSSTWYIQVSKDETTWTNVASQSATSMSKGTWEKFTANLEGYSDVYVRLYYDGSTAVRNVDDINITMRDPNAKKTPVVTIDATGITATDMAGNTNVAAGTLAATVTSGETTITTPAVTWSSSDTGVATVNATTGAVTLIGVGTATITASFAGNDDYTEASATYELTVIDSYAKGQLNNPYTVAEAIAATPASGTSEDVYISGIVSAFHGTSIMGDGTNYRYYISDNGTTTNQLLVYKGKGLNNVAFSNADDLQIGDHVVILGGLTTYNSTKEVAANNYIVSLNRPIIPSIDVASTTIDVPFEGVDDGTIEVTYNNFTLADAEVQFFGADGVTPATYDWITADINNDNDIEYIVEANTGEARTAYMKVYALDDETNVVYSELITINQAEYVAPVTGKYVKVTSTDYLSDGQYLIVYEDGSVAFNGGLNTLDAASNTIDVTLNNNEIDATNATKAAEFTIDVTNGTLKNASGLYIGVSSNSNGLKQTDNADTYTNSFTFDENGNAVISAVFEESSMTMRYNSASNQKRFRYYGSGQQAIQLYKFVDDVESESVTVTSAGYATFASDNALDFTGSSIKAFYATESKGTLSFTQVNKVPAGTGVLLYKDGGATVDVPVFTGEADDVTGNVFVRGADAAVTYAENDQNYILFDGEDGIGFYKANNNTVATNRAYIHVENGIDVKGFVINLEDDATGISDLKDSKDLNDSKVIYNLAGQMVNGKSVNGKLPKGIYIVNGKKIAVK